MRAGRRSHGTQDPQLEDEREHKLLPGVSHGLETDMETDKCNGNTEGKEDQGSSSKTKYLDSNRTGGTRRRPLSYLLCFIIGLIGGCFPSNNKITHNHNFNKNNNNNNSSISSNSNSNNNHNMNHSHLEQVVLNPLDSHFSTSTLQSLQSSFQNHSSSLSSTFKRPPRPLSLSLSILRITHSPPPLLIIVTPTYVRPFQSMYLTRLSNTLKVIPSPVLWLVVELSKQSMETAVILRQTGLLYRHLVTKKNMTDVKDRGVHQRNAALEHIEEHRLNGIVYFADDDNVYSTELFTEVRKVRRFGTWPVGFLHQGKARAVLEGPVCREGRVIGWHTNEKSKMVRRFHVDMCGFAFNSTILWDPARWQRPTTKPIRQLDIVKEGFQETTFIEQLVPDESAMEGLADNCSKILVWHLHLEAPRNIPFPHWSTKTKLRVTVPLSTSDMP